MPAVGSTGPVFTKRSSVPPLTISNWAEKPVPATIRFSVPVRPSAPTEYVPLNLIGPTTPWLFSVPLSVALPSPSRESVPTPALGCRKLPLPATTLVELKVNPHTPLRLAVVNWGWPLRSPGACAHPPLPPAARAITTISDSIGFLVTEQPPGG